MIRNNKSTKGRRRKTKRDDKRSKTEKVESKPEPKISYLNAPSVRPEILDRFGRRVARVIGDATKGQSIVASVAWFRLTTSELESMTKAGVIAGGFDDRGRRDGTPIVCNM